MTLVPNPDTVQPSVTAHAHRQPRTLAGVDVPMFRVLSDEDMDRLQAMAERRGLKAGERVFTAGARADFFYLVVSGQVRIIRGGNGRRPVVLRLVEPGGLFGLAGAMAFGAHHTQSDAVVPSVVLGIPADIGRDLISRDTRFAGEMIKEISCHLRETADLVERLEALPTPKRLGAYLLDVMERAPHDDETELRDPGAFILPAEKGLIAARLGMQPESLSRAFMKLRDYGVQSRGRRVKITEPERLRRFVMD